jgi:hypothetical protein
VTVISLRCPEFQTDNPHTQAITFRVSADSPKVEERAMDGKKF